MNTRQKIQELLDHFDTAMLVTTRADGQLGARPMHLAETNPDGHICLITSVEGDQAGEIAHDPRVLLVCQDRSGRYLALQGKATVADDRPRLRRVWKESYRVWFPDGPDADELRLIDVDPVAAEFWDSTGVNRLKHLWESAKVLAGERPSSEETAAHGKARL